MEAIHGVFGKLDSLRPTAGQKDIVEPTAQGSSNREHKCDNELETISMSSLDEPHASMQRTINFNDSDSEESMSVRYSDTEYTSESDGQEEFWSKDPESKPMPEVTWNSKKISDGTTEKMIELSQNQDKCFGCEAYNAHCKSAAEQYQRTLNRYTKTVQELMLGFKKVLEKYPELRHDPSDVHVSAMVQAALGRVDLVREMLRLASESQFHSALESGRSQKEHSVCDRDLFSVHEALSSRYTDGEALRMILQLYVNLYVRYIQVWRDMCSKVSSEITLMEFVDMTVERPGVTGGEPWSEARAYVCRVSAKVNTIIPSTVGQACVRALTNLDSLLGMVPPQKIEKHKTLMSSEIDFVRNTLDQSSGEWSWDFSMSDLYFDIRSDLAVLEALVDVGCVSVKTLLQERAMLVSKIRIMNRTQGFLELKLSNERSKLKEPKFVKLHTAD